MPPYGLYSLTDKVNLPEELGAEGYRYIDAFSPGLDSDFRQSLYQYDPAFGQLNASQRYLPAPYTGEMPFQAMFDVSPTFYGKANMGFDADLYNPSFGGVSGYRDTGGIMGIMQEEDEEDQLPYSGVGDMRYQTPRTIADQNRILGQTFTERKPSGIARLFEVLGNIPTPFNLARRGLESLQGFNRKIRGTTFALSPTLKDYVQAKRAEKRAAAGADVGVGPGGSGSRRGDADIASRDRGSFRTDDTAGFF